MGNRISDGFFKIRRRVNRLLSVSSLSTGIVLGKPEFICAKMTMRCNSRCAHCNIWHTDYCERELPTVEWRRILRELRSWLGPFRIVFTGGETLMRTDMIDILEYAVKLGIKVELLSNGLLVDSPIAEKLVETGIDQITISLDGMSPEVHDRFRGGEGYHEKTKNAILELTRVRQERKSPLDILLKTVIFSENLEELLPIAQWAREHGLRVRFQPIEQNYGEEVDPFWYRRSSLWVTDLEAVRSILRSLSRLRLQGSHIANSPHDFDRFIRYFERPDSMMQIIQAHYDTDTKKRCRSAVGSFVISSNGDVRMCFQMKPVGNVADRPPHAIWRERERCWSRPCPYW